jgi:hypothetical protein
MRKSIAWVTPVAVISVAALAALALDRDISVISPAQAEDLKAADSEALCPRGDATLLGTYMSRGGGTVVGATFTTTDDTQHYDMRVSPGGSKVDYIETDAGTVIGGSASRVND